MPAIVAALAAGAISALTNPEVAGAIGKGIASQFDPSAKLYRQQLKEDRRRIAANDFGFSEAQKNTQQAAANRLAQGATASTEADLKREQSASGGRGGAYAEARRGLASDLAGQGAESRGAIEKTSAVIGQQQREMALARLKERRGEALAQGEATAKMAVSGAKSFAKGYAGKAAALKDPEIQMDKTGQDVDYLDRSLRDQSLTEESEAEKQKRLMSMQGGA